MPLIVDVPKYWTRWLAEEASDRTYLGLVQGAIDAVTRWRADRDWAVWRGESTWMTLYISVAVLALVLLPRRCFAQRGGNTRTRLGERQARERDAWQRVSDTVERAVPGDSDRDGK